MLTIKEKTQKLCKVDHFQFDLNRKIKITDFDFFLATDIISKKECTLKRLNLTQSNCSEKYDTLLKQAKISKILKSNQIFKCKKLIKTQSHLNLVYELHAGKTLAEIIQKNHDKIQQGKGTFERFLWQHGAEAVSLTMIYQVGFQLAKVLKNCHQNSIVYVNLSPKFIYLDDKQQLKLMNFELAQILNEYQNDFKDYNTAAKISEHTYIAPECLKNHCFGFTSDMYSFGKILEQLYLLWVQTQKEKRAKSLKYLIDHMLSSQPQNRPTISEVYHYFCKQIQKPELKERSISSKAFSLFKENKKLNIPDHQNLSKEKKKLQSFKSQKFLVKSHNIESEIKKETVIFNQRKSFSNIREYSPRKLPPRSRNSVTHKTDGQINKQNKGSKLLGTLIMKRNQVRLLLGLSRVVLNQIKASPEVSLKLGFLLLKKGSLLSKKIHIYLKSFIKQCQLQQSFKLQNKRTQSRKLGSFSEVIQQQFNSLKGLLDKIGGQVRTLLETKAQQQSEGLNIQFKQQLEEQAFNNRLFLEEIREFILQSSRQPDNLKDKSVLFHLLLLKQIWEERGYSNFLAKNVQGDCLAFSDISYYQNLISSSTRLSKMLKMEVKELKGKLNKSLFSQKP